MSDIKIDFLEYVESLGADDPQMVMVFVEEFLENPGIFFELSESERGLWESRIDQMLEFFKD